MPNLDDNAELAKFNKFFDAGKQAFGEGKSLRDVFMTIHKIESKPYADTQSLGFVLGFADAALDKIRSL